MGVVSGIMMSYQFGTNWPMNSDRTGPVLGPTMGHEVMTAFFLETGFPGVMLLGMTRGGVHFLATAMVAIGTLFPAFWILIVDSRMHMPTGYDVNEVGRFSPVNWWEVVFNPAFPYRLVYMVLADYLSTALVVGAVGAWHLLSDATDVAARRMFAMGMSARRRDDSDRGRRHAGTE